MRFELAFAAVVLTTAVGCSSPATIIPTARVAQPEVVAVDFFGGNNATAACSGTLLAKNVVLTAAHCAMSGSKAFVRAPDANGQTASVKTVRFYDWQPSDTSDHASQHDLALLVLDKSIDLVGAYPKVWNANADGITATQAWRTSNVALDASTKRATIAIATGRPTGNPLMLTVPHAVIDAGGPLFGTDDDGNIAVVGVMVGSGAKSGTGYAARVADSKVRAWISGIVVSPNQAVTPPKVNLAGAHFFGDDGDDDDDGSGVDQSDSSGDSAFDDGGLATNTPASNDGSTPSNPDDSTATPSTSPSGSDTTPPSDSTPNPAAWPESSPAPASSSSDAEKIAPGGLLTTYGSPVSDTQAQLGDIPTTQPSDTQTQPGGLIQTYGYPVTDTQFQLIDRQNEVQSLENLFDTSQDAK